MTTVQPERGHAHNPPVGVPAQPPVVPAGAPAPRGIDNRERVGQGTADHQQFESEVLPHRAMLFSAAMRHTGNRQDAEDLVQDTLARAYRYFGQFEIGTNVRGWLLSIMHSMFINEVRKRGRRPQQAANADPHDDWVARVTPRASERSAEDLVMDHLTDTRLITSLRELSEEFRVPLWLYAVDGYHYQEVADMLGIPLGTVMSRIHRAKGKLREALIPRQETTNG